MNDQLFTVSELNKYIKDVISAGFPQSLWVCGEIQRLRFKNHLYFDLVEKDPNSNNISAKISCSIWAGQLKHINATLKKSENNFELKDEMEVKLRGKVSFYEPYGTLSLQIDDVDPTYTLGRWAQEKKKIIERLTKEKIFEENKKALLADVPLRIGLVTSFDSAAYNDVLSEFTKSGFGFKIILRDALVQGAKAEDDICRAVQELSQLKTLDCIVVTRGGGSAADLQCFESEKIARAVAACPLPVLSGIGHEIDFTITDMAAHTHAKTPTAIAQFLVNRVQAFLDRLDEAHDRVVQFADTALKEERHRLRNAANELLHATQHYFRDHREQMARFRQVLRSVPASFLKDQRRSVSEAWQAMHKTVKLKLAQERTAVEHFEKMINMLHPANTLKRGFSVTRTADGTIVRSVSDVKKHARLRTEVYGGVIDSDVIDVHKEDEGVRK